MHWIPSPELRNGKTTVAQLKAGVTFIWQKSASLFKCRQRLRLKIKPFGEAVMQYSCFLGMDFQCKTCGKIRTYPVNIPCLEQTG